MVIITKTDSGLLINFKFNWELVALIKSFQNKKFNKVNNTWTLPNYSLDVLIDKLEFGNFKYKIIDNSTPIKKCEYTHKLKLFPYQMEGFNYGKTKRNWLLGDEQGLGKTAQALTIAEYKKKCYGYKHCLIVVCVKNLRINWAREVAKFTYEDACIIEGEGNNLIQKRFNMLKEIPQEYFWIINLESLRDKKLSDLLRNYCRKNIISMLIVDEIHNAKNPTCGQTKGLLKLEHCKEKIVLTGTPIVNSPLDGFTILKLLGEEKSNWTTFKNYFCEYGGFGGYQILGFRNMVEYTKKLKSIMLRRLKKDVINLPEKILTTEYLEMDKAQQSIYNEVLEEIRKNIDIIKLNKNPLTKLLRLRQATAHTALLSTEIKQSVKFERLKEIIENCICNDQKVVVYSQSRKIIDMLCIAYSKYKPAKITGEIKDSDVRQANIDRFQNDKNCKLIFGTTKALGTGYTLTAATTAVFMDSPWNQANKDQAIDRLHRIGQTGTVNIITLVCVNTMDVKIEELIERKGSMSDLLVDGKIIKDSSLLDWLIS